MTFCPLQCEKPALQTGEMPVSLFTACFIQHTVRSWGTAGRNRKSKDETVICSKVHFYHKPGGRDGLCIIIQTGRRPAAGGKKLPGEKCREAAGIQKNITTGSGENRKDFRIYFSSFLKSLPL